MNLRTYLSARRGHQADLARSIGAHESDISRWANGSRPVPPVRCIAIERATAGAVTRRDLRPHDWQSIWPDLTPARIEAANA
ncbi:helix-turn-helix domain-containing protein [Achromobacter sp. ACM04]|uniref:transcriptional regulator n=1 Tax=Achromobacter sp. ACM04 TaxID=2769312 RepID=UPI00177EC5CA|nr:YdaS family helix-turn-helix protein [Achromobacter sp. ACM04]MBD9419840.1 helix-turn-helix domain-containing protein [Achromobacter sp. ACM04]